MEVKHFERNYDFVAVGAGMPAVFAAVVAARMGVKTALISNRSCLGGNGSCEIGIGLNGADGTSEFNFNSREMGIIGELVLEHLYRNKTANRYIWDSYLHDFTGREENLTVYLNTYIDEAEVKDGKIVSVTGTQNTTEKRFTFRGDLFLDDTGDGALSALVGADLRMGREARSEYNEAMAPEEADNRTMLATLIYDARDTGKPVRFVKPSYALDVEKEGITVNRYIPEDRYSVCWYYEIGAGKNQIYDSEEIAADHRALTYGIWDYVKNSGKIKGAENYDLDFVSLIPGKRESRRIMGDYVLNQNDIVNRVDFEDTIAYGGWSVDLHNLDGVYSAAPVNAHCILRGIYQIPYRCMYSRSIDNLFVAGRCMSTTHVGYGTTRVIGTLAICGHAVGTAVGLCKKYGVLPRGIYQNHMKELQQTLIEQDAYVVGRKWESEKDLALSAEITASSELKMAFTQPDRFYPMEKPVAFTIPVNQRLDQVQVYLKAEEDTQITYKASVSKKRENYNPEILLKEGKVQLKKGYQWAIFDVNCDVDNQFVFFELGKNSAVSIGLQKDQPSCMVTLDLHPMKEENIWESDHSRLKESHWFKIMNSTACFKTLPEQPAYAASNINDGYFRPEGTSHLWLSDNKVAGEWMEINLREKKSVHELTLLFDPDFDRSVSNRGRYEFDVIDTIVKDYTVYADDVEIAKVQDNIMRVNKIDLGGRTCQKIKVVFDATNGSKRVGVYGVRVK